MTTKRNIARVTRLLSNAPRRPARIAPNTATRTPDFSRIVEAGVEVFRDASGMSPATSTDIGVTIRIDGEFTEDPRGSCALKIRITQMFNLGERDDVEHEWNDIDVEDLFGFQRCLNAAIADAQRNGFLPLES